MKCARKQAALQGGRHLPRAGLWVLEMVAGYGERPWRVGPRQPSADTFSRKGRRNSAVRDDTVEVGR